MTKTREKIDAEIREATRSATNACKEWLLSQSTESFVEAASKADPPAWIRTLTERMLRGEPSIFGPIDND